MVLGLAAMAGGVATALPMGWLFGYGYGHGVRTGYHDFKPSQNPKTTSLHKSLNPLTGSMGAGMLSAEEITKSQASKAGMQTPEMATPEVNPNAGGGYWDKTPHYESPDGRRITKTELSSIASKHELSKREAYHRFIKQKYPFNPKGYKQGRPSRN